MKTLIFSIAFCAFINTTFGQGVRLLTQAELLNLAAQESAALQIENAIRQQTQVQQDMIFQMQQQQQFEQLQERIRLMNQQLNSNYLINAN
jgi:hypothetical protein